jgi:thioesterase domain-containing protein
MIDSSEAEANGNVVQHDPITLDNLPLPDHYIEQIKLLPEHLIEQTLNNINHESVITNRYQAQFYRGKVSLFLATDKENESVNKGWNNYLESLDVIPMDADHYTIMDGDNVKIIADCISKTMVDSDSGDKTMPQAILQEERHSV